MHLENIRLNSVLYFEKARNESHNSEKISVAILGECVRL